MIKCWIVYQLKVDAGILADVSSVDPLSEQNIETK